MSSRFSLVVMALFVVGATGAMARPQSIADCESLQAADAYNRCLASFGPAAGGRGASSSVEAPSERELSQREEYARPHGRRHGSAIEHRRRGRVRMVLTPGRGGR